MKKIRLIFSIWWYEVKSFFVEIKRSIWNKHLLLWWYRLWIRRDEFHKSLDVDPAAMMGMNEKKGYRYIKALIRRRNVAHERDLARY